MTLRKWNYLFWTTLLIGTVVGMATSVAIKLIVSDFVFLGVPVGWYEWIFMLFGASMIAVLSQMGFFAYLTVRYVAGSFFRGKLLYWNILQVVLIVVALFDLVYLRYTGASADESSLLQYIILPIFIMLAAVLVAYLKVRATNPTAWIPTLFFMSVVTIVEAVPAFNLNDAAYTIIMVAPLLACNAWQIMVLHRLLPSPGQAAAAKPANG